MWNSEREREEHSKKKKDENPTCCKPWSNGLQIQCRVFLWMAFLVRKELMFFFLSRASETSYLKGKKKDKRGSRFSSPDERSALLPKTLKIRSLTVQSMHTLASTTLNYTLLPKTVICHWPLPSKPSKMRGRSYKDRCQSSKESTAGFVLEGKDRSANLVLSYSLGRDSLGACGRRRYLSTIEPFLFRTP